MTIPSLATKLLAADYASLLYSGLIAKAEIMGFNSLGLWIQAIDSEGNLKLYVVTDITSTTGLLTAQIGDGSNKIALVAGNVNPPSTAGQFFLPVKLGINNSGNVIGTVSFAAGATVQANQGTGNAGAGWGVITQTSTLGAAVPSTAIAVASAKDASGNLQFLPLALGLDFGFDVPIVIDKTLTGTLNVAQQGVITTVPIGAALNATAFHITTNATTNVTAALAYVSSIVITTDAAGTTSTVTIQDKSATPKKLVNAAVTTAISTTPTVLALTAPVLMTGGIDIITAGVAAATIDVWVSYYQ